MTADRTRRRGPVIRAAAAVVGILAAGVLPVASAAAHDATTSAYAHVERDGVTIEVQLELEYDLLMTSAWTYAEAYEATERAEQLSQLAANADAVDHYVTERFAVDADGERCLPRRTAGPADIRERDERAFAVLRYAYDCAGGAQTVIAVSSALFPDVEGFVHDTVTLVEWELDGVRGNGLLDAGSPTLELGEAPRFGEFFLLGVEHLVLGLDHLLFLVALLLGARSIRGVVITATTFTVAHSVTFLLAGMGLVNLPAVVVEPVIALSIVAAAAATLSRGELSARVRMPVVFAFGLVHGLGFASALGIDERWSWELLWSLLAFNIGVEAVQLAIIGVAFPLLVLLRRTAAADPATRVAGVLVGAVGLLWFAERLLAAFRASSGAG